jgi:SagB-type dehydrogenase family enzyme
MKNQIWENLLLEPSDDDNYVWELFHENSKTDKQRQYISDEIIAAKMGKMSESLDYQGRQSFLLPEAPDTFDMTLAETLISRVTPASIKPGTLKLDQVAALLYYSYGITRDKKGNNFSRYFRCTPSGGGMFPLEIYIGSKHIEEIPSGIFHYNPIKNQLRLILEGDPSSRIAETLVPSQANLAFDSSITIFISGLFRRSTFKYQSRGYRFVFLEAGHVAQNINLVATALGLGCINIGGYFDHDADELLGFDGLNQSTIYMQAIGTIEKIHQIPKGPHGQEAQSLKKILH